MGYRATIAFLIRWYRGKASVGFGDDIGGVADVVSEYGNYDVLPPGKTDDYS